MVDLRPFLSAEWRYLLILNYEIDPVVLAPLIPAGTELDLWQGKALVSVVGFRFMKTRVLGLPVPFHRNFEEVNLRFYVRREDKGDVRRGVCFVKEIVPRPAIAGIARWLYGENYVALPMRHTIETGKDGFMKDGLVEYGWRFKGKLNRMGGLGIGEAQALTPGSEEEFISEHYWGYTRLDERTTGEYQVDHPAWRIWQVAQPYLLCDIRGLYGLPFEPFLHRRPRSAFLAEGSPITVFQRKVIKLPAPPKPAKPKKQSRGSNKFDDRPA